MGEYKFSIYAKWQLGFLISFDGQIVLSLPFVDVRVAVSKYATGFNIFGWYIS